jgi:CRISPR system Cascade subunit CasC
MGGVERLRVSSQSLKRAWRTSDLFEQAMTDHLGTRTKEMGRKVYAQLVEKGVAHKSALSWAAEIAGVFGKLKKISDKEKKAIKDLPAVDQKEKELVEVEIEQLAFFDLNEEQSILDLTNLIAERKEGPEKEELDLLRKKMTSVDIALFGRMLASSPAYNVEAACQVAHAISVHPVVIEDDYFTAVDDLNDGSEDSGAAHIGETSFAAGLFYSYICINRDLLVENLGGDEGLAQRGIAALTESAVKVSPKGKQNSFASRAYASYVMAEIGEQQPRSLSVAFLKPINNRTLHFDEKDFGSAAIDALQEHRENQNKVYGDCSDDSYSINALAGEGMMEELLKFVIS